jgi:L-asparaginase/Glu-tRNA(Gln) amidotransferase subunit D
MPQDMNQIGNEGLPHRSQITPGVLANIAEVGLSNELEPKAVHAEAISGGGTWGMDIDEFGNRRGEGKLGDKELRELQTETGLFAVDLKGDRKQARAEITNINHNLAISIYNAFQASLQDQAPQIEEQIGEWCNLGPEEGIGKYLEGQLITLYSGDSSQLRPYIVAPIAMVVLERMAADPTTPRLVGMGTDTADLLVPTLDAFTFDAGMAPIGVTGANHPHKAEDSDAPENFMATGKILGRRLPPGAYYVFGRGANLFKGIDLLKIDPKEARQGGLEGQSTFYAPQGTQSSISTLLEFAPLYSPDEVERQLPENHVLNNMDIDKLYKAMTGVLVVDLGDQNAGEIIMDQVFDDSVKSVVVAGHSLGNADNEVRHYLVEASKGGKNIIVVSRSLIGQTDTTYDAALLKENEEGGALHGTETPFINGANLNPAAARAAATRGLVEGLSPDGLQNLIDRWRNARGMG